MDQQTRRAINDDSVRQFLSAWDPFWRWILLLGLLDARRNPGRLGNQAAERTGGESLREDEYLFGPLVLGLTAAAVNETALHCEDLFALLRFAGDRELFVQRMMSYGAGHVTNFGTSLAKKTAADIRKLYFVPSPQLLSDGLASAEDPRAALATAEEAVLQLVAMTHGVVDWYETYSQFHLQYKHGLTIAFRPFGRVTQEAIEGRKANVSGPVIALSNEPLSEVAKRPNDQKAMIIMITPNSQPHLKDMANERNLLHYRLAGSEIDLEELVAASWTIVRLLQILIHNRVALIDGPAHDGMQLFKLPAPGLHGTVDVYLRTTTPITLDHFS
jgi:hypothetical protein